MGALQELMWLEICWSKAGLLSMHTLCDFFFLDFEAGFLFWYLLKIFLPLALCFSIAYWHKWTAQGIGLFLVTEPLWLCLWNTFRCYIYWGFGGYWSWFVGVAVFFNSRKTNKLIRNCCNMWWLIRLCFCYLALSIMLCTFPVRMDSWVMELIFWQPRH